jgi:hypothetical protein
VEEEIELPGELRPASRVQRAALAVARRDSLLSGDLEQRPFWLRVLLLLFVLALSAGLFLAAFQAVKLLRGSL